MPTINGYSSVLQAVAETLADGCDGCCGHREENGECCMTERARSCFQAIHDAGGPSLERIEAIAAGQVILAVPLGDR